MAFNGSELLGQTELAGVVVNPLGAFKRTLSSQGAGGPVVGAIWGKIFKDKLAEERVALEHSDTPEFGGQAHLSVTAEQVAICHIASNKLGTDRRLDRVVASMPRDQVVSAELGKGSGPGASLPLTITFANGAVWTVEVGRILRRSGEKVLEVLRTGA